MRRSPPQLRESSDMTAAEPPFTQAELLTIVDALGSHIDKVCKLYPTTKSRGNNDRYARVAEYRELRSKVMSLITEPLA